MMMVVMAVVAAATMTTAVKVKKKSHIHGQYVLCKETLGHTHTYIHPFCCVC